eukprot:5561337-Karenia_brevis.AAC.1
MCIRDRLISPQQASVTSRQGEGDSVAFPVRSVAAPNPNEEANSPTPQRTPMVRLGAAQHSPTTPAPSAQDMVNVIEGMTGAFKEAMKTTVDEFRGMQ